ncbi:hypothetical protein GQR58_024774 [Nymphon striatum]|nr:hypothetical protein GQR58_024774 [Nymphon striatum]
MFSARSAKDYGVVRCGVVMPQLERLDEGVPEWFQQDGAPDHFATVVRDWLNDNFSNWIGRHDNVEWSPRQQILAPLTSFLRYAEGGVPNEN